MHTLRDTHHTQTVVWHLEHRANMKIKGMIKTIFIFMTFMILIPFQIQAQSDNLETGITEIIKAFDTKDSDLISKYIHPGFGLFVLFRRGIMDEYQRTDKIDFENPIPEYLPYFGFKINLSVDYTSLPSYDCDSGKWSKAGLFCDTLKIDTLLSNTAANLVKWRGDKIDQGEIKTIKKLEKTSHRIVIIDNEEGELIFHLTLLNGKWYFTILDRVSSDCSA